MKRNPQIVLFETGYAIRFVRNNWKVLLWVQDLSSKKMKSDTVNLPAIIFTSKHDAEQEVQNIVIPYLLYSKGVSSSDIIGW